VGVYIYESESIAIVTSRNTHVTLLTNLGQFWTCHTPCQTPCTSSTSELISPWSTAITASHQPQDSQNLVPHSNSGITNATLNISLSSLVPVQVPVPILVPVPVPCFDIAFLCFPSCTHCFPVFRSVFWYVPVPNGYTLWLVYIDPHLVLYSICSNIDFDYCSHCLLDLWSLPTSIWLP